MTADHRQPGTGDRGQRDDGRPPATGDSVTTADHRQRGRAGLEKVAWRGKAAAGVIGGVGVLASLLAGCGGGGEETAGETTAVGSTASVGDDSTLETTSTTAAALPTPAPTSTDVATTSDETTIVATDDGGEATTTASSMVTDGGKPPSGLDCTAACNLVLEGDSLFHSFVDTLCIELGTLTCVNSGIVGNRVDQMVVTARSDVDVHVGGGDNDVLVLWAGTNDLWQQFHSADPGENAETTYGWISTYLAERRAAGWDYLIVMTLPPANPEVIRGDGRLNELIRANSAGADAVIDLAAEPKLADPFDPVLKAVDGVHYTDPGRSLVLNDHLAPAIRGLDG